jgi:hypothetical protein
MPKTFKGHGASGFASLKASIVNHVGVQQVPIAVVGEGAAGILVTAALRIIGFKNVHLYEKRAALGIWSQDTVYKGTKNNPRKINFNAHTALNVAKGDGTKDGAEVREFLGSIRGSFGPTHRNDEEPVESITPDTSATSSTSSRQRMPGRRNSRSSSIASAPGHRASFTTPTE